MIVTCYNTQCSFHSHYDKIYTKEEMLCMAYQIEVNDNSKCMTYDFKNLDLGVDRKT